MEADDPRTGHRTLYRVRGLLLVTRDYRHGLPRREPAPRLAVGFAGYSEAQPATGRLGATARLEEGQTRDAGFLTSSGAGSLTRPGAADVAAACHAVWPLRATRCVHGDKRGCHIPHA